MQLQRILFKSLKCTKLSGTLTIENSSLFENQEQFLAVAKKLQAEAEAKASKRSMKIGFSKKTLILGGASSSKHLKMAYLGASTLKVEVSCKSTVAQNAINLGLNSGYFGACLGYVVVESLNGYPNTEFTLTVNSFLSPRFKLNIVKLEKTFINNSKKDEAFANASPQIKRVKANCTAISNKLVDSATSLEAQEFVLEFLFKKIINSKDKILEYAQFLQKIEELFAASKGATATVSSAKERTRASTSKKAAVTDSEA